MNFPKIHCPFIRKEINGKYVVIDEINPGFEWCFDPSEPVIIQEKLHGTNCKFIVQGMGTEKHLSVTLRDSKNKSHVSVSPLHGQGRWNWLGVMNYICAKPGKVKPGEYFGEIVGPKINGNPHGLAEHRWCDFRPSKFWSVKKFNHHPERTGAKDVDYRAWEEFILYLKSNTFREAIFCEGVVFLNLKTGERAKLRADMYPEFSTGSELKR